LPTVAIWNVGVAFCTIFCCSSCCSLLLINIRNRLPGMLLLFSVCSCTIYWVISYLHIHVPCWCSVHLLGYIYLYIYHSFYL
jgi:hypothetical protein